MTNESVVCEGSFALLDNLFWIIISFGLLILPIYLYQKTHEIGITKNRVIGKKGIISRDTIDFSMSNIESIDVKQSILGRIFGYGNIALIGTGGSKKVISALKHPEKFKQAITEARFNS